MGRVEVDFCFCRSFRFSTGIAIDFFFLCGPKMTFFNVEIDLFGFRVGGRNRLGVCMRAENHLVLVRASNLTSFLCGWSRLTRSPRGGSNLT